MCVIQCGCRVTLDLANEQAIWRWKEEVAESFFHKVWLKLKDKRWDGIMGGKK